VTLEPDADERQLGPVEAYLVVSEALANVAKAARRRMPRWWCGGRVTVEISGAGGADAARGSGLSGLADRVAALDGRLEIVSPAGAGTTVRAEIPCGS
jgi:signal transduction histidine kinase